MSQDLVLPVQSDPAQWPITKLHSMQVTFLMEVVERIFRVLQSRYREDRDLYPMLTQTAIKELARIASDPWDCDPKDDTSFWKDMKEALHHEVDANKLLKRVIERYVGEISSQFSVWHYHLVAKSSYHTFIKLLKPYTSACCALKNKKPEKSLHVMGKVDMIRALAQKGTFVLVPTHSSNWDSMIIGLAMKELGVPPLSWGAGLNLFNNPGFRFIFTKLGTYKIDRRKRTIPYLQAQKCYTSVTLEWGCHMLFYPAGTRSRSGAIETHLKLGLLGMLFEAQWNNFQKYGITAKKLFIVPMVLNYHCVLEAPQLVRETTQAGGPAVMQENCCSNKLWFNKKIFLKESEVFINIGAPLDVLGNKIDVDGRSWNETGEEVDLYEQFLHFPEKASAKSNNYIKHLSHKIVEDYYRTNTVLSSHLVAFVAYELAQTMEDASRHLERIVLERESFIFAIDKTFQALCILQVQRKISFTPLLDQRKLGPIILHGISKLGIYHTKPPLSLAGNGDLIIEDIWTLWYYHNRLTGYGLERIFQGNG